MAATSLEPGMPVSASAQHPDIVAASTTTAEATEAVSIGAGAGIVVAWAATGLVAAYVLRRRGHAFKPAAVLGFVFGPLFVPLARRAVRDEPLVPPRTLSEGERGPGPVDVLIGLSGPGDAVWGLRPVLELLGDRVGRVTIAVAVDYDAAASGEWTEAACRAALDGELAAALLADRWLPDTVLVPGRPVAAFVRYAAAAHHDLVVCCAGRRLPMAGAGGLPIAVVAPAEQRGSTSPPGGGAC